ncbi:MAG: hypothetical protein SH818_12345 [Saprospiraceae bacterium]|nr:hypothetical protein [Saprospiraceae bacterium]
MISRLLAIATVGIQIYFNKPYGLPLFYFGIPAADHGIHHHEPKMICFQNYAGFKSINLLFL